MPKQILRSETPAGPHFREGIRARSGVDFIRKIELGRQEFEETVYSMELLVQSRTVEEKWLQLLMQEADEPTAIIVTCAK